MRLFRYLKNVLFGYDIFISYSRKDSLDYAYALAKHFMAQNYSCYIDQLSSVMPGKELPQNIEDAIVRSTAFVLIGSEGAQDSGAIEKEIRIFLNDHKNKPLIPIAIDGAINEKACWFGLIDGLPLASDSTENLISGNPGDGVLDRIGTACTFTKKAVKIRNSAVLVFAGVLLIASAATIYSWKKDQEALAATKNEANERLVATVQENKAGAAHKQLLATDSQLVIASKNLTDARHLAGQKTREADSDLLVAKQQLALSNAVSINSAVENNKINYPDNSQLRAILSERSYEIAANPGAVQNLAAELSTHNHFQAQLKLPGFTKVVISTNGRYLAGWSEERSELGVYELVNYLPVLRHSQSFNSFKLGRHLALAISNDGYMIAINRVDDHKGSVSLVRTDDHWRSNNVFESIAGNHDSYWFNDLQFSPDGNYLFGNQQGWSIGDVGGHGVILFRVKVALKPVRIIEGDARYSALHVALSSAGEQLAILYLVEDTDKSRNMRKEIQLISLPGLKTLRSITNVDENVSAVNFSPSGKELILSVPGSYQYINDLNTFKDSSLAKELDRKELPSYAKHVFFFGDGQYMALAGEFSFDNTPTYERPISEVMVLSKWQEYPEVIGHISNTREYLQKPMNAGDIVSMGIDEKYSIITTDAGGIISVWDPFVRFGYPRASFGALTGLQTARNGNDLYFNEILFNDSAHGGEQRRLLQVSNWQSTKPVVREIVAEPRYESHYVLSKKGDLYAKIFYVKSPGVNERPSRHIHIYSAQNNALVCDLDYRAEKPYASYDDRDFQFQMDDNEKYLAALDRYGQLGFWKLNLGGRNLAPLAEKQIADYYMDSFRLNFTHDGRTLLVAFRHTVQIYRDLPQNKLNNFSHFDFKENGPIVDIMTSFDDSIMALALESGHVLVRRNWKQNPVTEDIRMDPSPGYSDAPHIVLGIDFHPSKNVIAIIDREQVQVRDLGLRDPWIKLPRPSFQTGSDVKFSADGKYIISSCADQHDYVFWLWDPADIMAEGRQHFIYRTLTAAETRQYLYPIRHGRVYQKE